MTRKNSNHTLTSVLHQEVRREYCGSVYWVRSVGRDQWMLTADGVAISHPSDREAALRALDAVAPAASSNPQIPS